MKFIEYKAGPRVTPLRVATDLIFAMTLLFAVALVLLGILLGVMYWTKVDLNIDLFEDHVLNAFGFLIY